MILITFINYRSVSRLATSHAIENASCVLLVKASNSNFINGICFCGSQCTPLNKKTEGIPCLVIMIRRLVETIQDRFIVEFA
jgi:hypothetical protein